jgi:glycosyltransferase involved in cell wall biosynthesis
MTLQRISVVIPVLNEEAVLTSLVTELKSVMEGKDFLWNVLFVDDGSTDGTLQKLKEIYSTDSRFTSISFSRHFGKEEAIAAGLRYARGDAVILMDADLEHPPSTIINFINCWRQGYKVVFGARQGQTSGSPLRSLASRWFNAVFQRIARTQLPVGLVDFLLLDRQAVDVLNQLPEKTRFSKGLYVWIGFPRTVVRFDTGRTAARTSRWRFFDLAKLALNGLISFSNLPLKICSYVGVIVSLVALVYAAYIVVSTLMFGTDVPGFPSVLVSIIFFAGIQLISLGIVGEYIARVYDEAKGRPLYVVAEEIGIPKGGQGHQGTRHEGQGKLDQGDK